jgi:hypothetical protein
MIPKDEWVHLVPDAEGEQINAHHCKDGKGNDKLYVKRIKNGAVAYCHHCGKHGYASVSFLARGEAAAGSKVLASFGGRLIGARESGFLPSTEITSAESDRGAEAGIVGRVPGADRIYLPTDSVGKVNLWSSTPAKIWILSYLSKDQVENNGICYSEKLSSIVFPRFLDGNLVSYQTRKFPTGDPKYLTYGKGIYNSISNTTNYSNKLVLVEDMVSAIKVSYHVSAFPLSGVSLSDAQLAQLLHRYNSFAVMLDNDNWKVKMAQIKLLRKLSCYGSARVINLISDPKSYSNYDLGIILKDFLEAE